MNALLRTAVRLLPRSDRARYEEQWAADLRDAHEQGVSRAAVLVGALGFAAGRSVRSARTALAPWATVRVLVVLICLIAMLLYVIGPDDALLAGRKVVLRDDLDVFGEFVNTPFVLLTPALAGLLVAGRRAAVESATAPSVSGAVRRLLTDAAAAFVVFTAWCLAAFVLAFVVWPLLGDPSVAPYAYDLTGSSAIEDSWGRVTYSQLLQTGTWAYGAFYSGWFGSCAATFAVLGGAALRVTRRRWVATAFPFVVFVAGSLAADLAGAPGLALQASMQPFGMTQRPIAVGLAPMLALMVVTVAVWATLLLRAGGRTASAATD